ncbi:MAG: hypothetical protein ACN6O3_07265 [Comamonas sp.]
MQKLIGLAVLVSILAGCAVYTPVAVEPRKGGRGNDFCPPGQAKKGNC